MVKLRFLVASILPVLLLASHALPAMAGGLNDPFSTARRMAPSPADAGICDIGIKGKKLSLSDVIQYSLCNNPQTRAAWASVRSAAAQLGVSESSLLPSLTVQGSVMHGGTRTAGTTTISNQQSATLSLSYLLYDFGGRKAGIDNALELLAAANASGNSTLQTVFLNAAQAYFSLMSARASVAASLASEKSARESLAAAEARYEAGTATPADRLQAKTALAQATLTRVSAEGTMYNALGTLANAMGVSPTVKLDFAEPVQAQPDIALEKDVGELIAEAEKQRPDLAAADAQVRAAKASIASAQATGMPQLTVDASASDSSTALSGSSYTPTGSSSVSLNLSFPLFTGFNTTYQTLAAEAQMQNSIANRDQLAQQIMLQVWQAYQNLKTDGQALRTSEDLLASAKESEALNLGRYREGVGNILDLLTAQSALASARQQHVSALYTWHAARFALAQAIGTLDLTTLQKIRRMEQ